MNVYKITNLELDNGHHILIAPCLLDALQKFQPTWEWQTMSGGPEADHWHVLGCTVPKHADDYPRGWMYQTELLHENVRVTRMGYIPQTTI